MERELAGVAGELVVVAPAASREARAVRAGRLVTVAGEALVPELWRAGILASTGDLVALTIAQSVPEPGWLGALLSALDATSAAVGGAFRLGTHSPATAAAFFLRYAAYRPPFPRRPVDQVPGDNALYRRRALEAVAEHWREGFWENEVNAALRARGERLVLDPRPLVTVQTVGGVVAFCHQRWRHGRRFGAWRARQRGGRWRAALVPLGLGALLLRTVRRTPPAELPLLLASFPWLVLFLLCWSSGELLGLLRGWA
ncbi:MAG: hypothetical protein K6U89_01355 [Chloroflexi bacterium]|nr:hypothetical protein [Chloroflexota bacterium]